MGKQTLWVNKNFLGKCVLWRLSKSQNIEFYEHEGLKDKICDVGCILKWRKMCSCSQDDLLGVESIFAQTLA